MSDPIEGPRITELRQRVTEGDTGAVEAFWRRAADEGTPIIEPIAGDDAHRLVTLVYRATQPHENVAILPGIENQNSARKNLMTLLPGTDVWYRTYVARSDLRTTYQFSPDDPMPSVATMSPEEMTRYAIERVSSWLTDPFNPRQFAYTPGVAPQAIVELPDAPPQPYIEKRAGVPEGTIEREDIASDPFGAGRRVWTYLPPGYDAAKGPYPVIVYFDGWGGRKLAAHTTLDNMIAEGIIPPSICVMLHQLDRNIELPCNATFADWLADDFVRGWVRERFAVTDDPARTVVTGMSYGGLAAAWCGLRRPDVFGNVLSQSGSYWWGGDALGEHAWLTRQYEETPRQPLRWYMDIGLLEDMRRGPIPTMLDANRRLRDVLTSKGYDLHYAEYNGGHDYVCWRGSFADGLTALLGR